MLAVDWSAVSSVVALVAEDTATVMRDWFFKRFLGNLDIVVILTALRMWSQSEHRRTAEALRVARKELAETVAATAATTAATSTAQNAEILKEVQTNTSISTQAFHEANSVNQKIAALREDQNSLRRDTDHA